MWIIATAIFFQDDIVEIEVNQKEDTPSIKTNVKDYPANDIQTSNTSTGTHVDKEISLALNFQEVSWNSNFTTQHSQFENY